MSVRVCMRVHARACLFVYACRCMSASVWRTFGSARVSVLTCVMLRSMLHRLAPQGREQHRRHGPAGVDRQLHKLARPVRRLQSSPCGDCLCACVHARDRMYHRHLTWAQKGRAATFAPLRVQACTRAHAHACTQAHANAAYGVMSIVTYAAGT